MTVEVHLTNSNKVAVIDDADWEIARRYSWRLSTCGYAVTTIKTKATMMHRILLNAAPGVICDHVNRDRLDNRRANLRFCTHSENMANCKMRRNNKLGVRGVWREGAVFRAQVRKGALKLTKSFKTIESAAQWVRETSVRVHGEFASFDGLPPHA